jgi:pyruvate/2-oxoglutarate dehydrogenase complex dihydrolipoamide dehydrogenase (E3) component
VAALNLGSIGADLDERGGDPADRHCRVNEGLWALGDVTGMAIFTHVAKYQGRIVADNILGRERVASQAGIPRVIFADPEIATVSLTAGSVRQRGMDVATAESRSRQRGRFWELRGDPGVP